MEPKRIRRWPSQLVQAALLPVALAGLSNLSPPPASSAEPCPGAETTLALRACLGERLDSLDRELERQLAALIAEAAAVPSGSFQRAWRDLTGELATTANPGRQLRHFRRERRRICQLVHSISVQGSGFGVFVLSCELDLTETLLRRARD